MRAFPAKRLTASLLAFSLLFPASWVPAAYADGSSTVFSSRLEVTRTFVGIPPSTQQVEKGAGRYAAARVCMCILAACVFPLAAKTWAEGNQSPLAAKVQSSFNKGWGVKGWATWTFAGFILTFANGVLFRRGFTALTPIKKALRKERNGLLLLQDLVLWSLGDEDARPVLAPLVTLLANTLECHEDTVRLKVRAWAESAPTSAEEELLSGLLAEREKQFPYIDKESRPSAWIPRDITPVSDQIYAQLRLDSWLFSDLVSALGGGKSIVEWLQREVDADPPESMSSYRVSGGEHLDWATYVRESAPR
jgi:hypothetical protein